MRIEIIRDTEKLSSELTVAEKKKLELEFIREESKGWMDWKTKAELKNLAGKFNLSIGDVLTVVNRLAKIHPEWVQKRLEQNENVVNVYSPKFFNELIQQFETK